VITSFLVLMFHKVVWQCIWSEVEHLLVTYCKLPGDWQWKN